MTLPTLTKKQREILVLIYKFRYLNRVQLQTLLKHKNHRRIHAWLNDLVSKNCLERIYSTKMPDNTKPAVYYLAKYGRKVLAKMDKENYTTQQLQNTYRDGQRTEVYRQACLFLADCYLSILSVANQQRFTLATFSTHADFTSELLTTFAPDAYIVVEKGRKKERKRHALFLLHERTPKYFLRYRLRHIVNFFTEDAWQSSQTIPFPTILIVATKTRIRNYAHKVLGTKLAKSGNPDVVIYLTTLYDFKTQGLYGKIWQRVTVEDV